MDAPQYALVDLDDEQVAEEHRVLGGLTDSVRALVDATVRTTVPLAEVAEVAAEVQRLADRLRREQIPGSFGVSFTGSGQVRGYGNAVVGLRNAVAVPLRIEVDETGRGSAEFELGAAYEGPPGMVHGGVLALLLDQVFGEAAAAGGGPGMTGTLTLRYRKPTPLGACSIRAWVDRVEGVKTFVQGEFRRADGETTVEAEGIFITPRWVRDATTAEGWQPPRFE